MNSETQNTYASPEGRRSFPRHLPFFVERRTPPLNLVFAALLILLAPALLVVGAALFIAAGASDVRALSVIASSVTGMVPAWAFQLGSVLSVVAAIAFGIQGVSDLRSNDASRPYDPIGPKVMRSIEVARKGATLHTALSGTLLWLSAIIHESVGANVALNGLSLLVAVSAAYFFGSLVVTARSLFDGAARGTRLADRGRLDVAVTPRVR